MMKNKVLLLACVLVLIISAISFTAAEKDSGEMIFYIGSSKAVVFGSTVLIDEDNEDVITILRGGRTFLPVRFVAENFGLSVMFAENENKVTLKGENTEISLIIGKASINIDGSEKELEAAPFLSNKRTYLPLRAIGEALGKQVFYDRGLVIINSGAKTYDAAKDSAVINEHINTLCPIPAVGTEENLAALFPNAPEKGASINTTGGKAGGGGGSWMSWNGTAPEAAAPVPAGADSNASKSEYSGTNVQVEGVDEADIVKTDGKYIYRLADNTVYIVDAAKPKTMNVVSKIELKNADQTAYATDMYVDGDKLIIMGHGFRYYPEVKDSAITPIPLDKNAPNGGAAGTAIAKPGYVRNGHNIAFARVYDISNIEKPSLARTVETDGNYMSSRKIGSSIYLVSNEYFYYYKGAKPEEVIPFSKDTAISGDYSCIPLDCVRYVPGNDLNSYAVVTGFDINNMKKPAKSSAYLGAGQNIYVSLENMYVTSYKYEPSKQEDTPIGVVKDGDLKVKAEDPYKTIIYKFSLNGGDIQFLSRGSVPGNVLNQFSMDEYGKHFRIATTSSEWNSRTSSSNVFVLDEAMQQVGEARDIAPGERIYSVRYMGEKAYMVTFRQTDPLFVISLKDPEKPEILGYLKIPGFSNYIHPYDENHIIGFGMDATDNGRATGIKIAMFDVSDVTSPKEMYKEIIGTAGSSTPLQYDHKALLFSKEKGLLALPLMVYEAADKNQYGSFAFQGAYIYNISLEKGFELKGKITHLSKSDYTSGGYNQNKFLDRILYIDDILFTSSPKYIMSNDINTLDMKGLAELK